MPWNVRWSVIKALFRLYVVLAAVFAVGMLACMMFGQPALSKLFALGLLWCSVGVFVNSGKLAGLVDRIGKWGKHG